MLHAMFDEMRNLTDKRHDEGAAKRRGLAVFAALWISLGLQPCAMATVSDVDCPHCPAEQVQPMAAGSDHCEPQGESSSGTLSDCFEAEESAVNGRLGQSDGKDAGKFSAAIPTGEPFLSIPFDICSNKAVDPPNQAVRARPIPLHILYCVYRD